MRVEGGSPDHFGYGTLTFTLDADKSAYPPSPVPPLPTKLIADAGLGRVFLRWQSSGETAQGYTISRATAADGPFVVISTWDNNTRCEFIDTDVKAGTQYFYSVAARNQAGTSAPCRAAMSATPADAGPLPAGWTLSEIGETVKDATAGFADVSGGTFVVRGCASGTGRSADAICFVNQAIAGGGDVTFTARISSVTWARDGKAQKIGIMIRQSLDPDSATFVMKLGDVGTRQAGAGARQQAGGDISWKGGNDYTWIPAWFRLKRAGDTFTAYESSDGETWFQVSIAEIPMRGDYRVGLFVSSGADSTNTTQFDFVSLQR
jgi:hypothetical protein